MTLIKTSILSFFATCIKILTGLISVKVIAVYIGPAGIALVGQFQNFIGIMNSISSAGIFSGIVKYTAEYRDNIEAKKKIWSNALFLFVMINIPLSVLMIFFSTYLSEKLFHTEKYWSVFIIYAFTLVFFTLYGFLTSILNGQKEIKRLITLNIFSSVLGLIITVSLVLKLGIYGALISGIISQSIVFFIALLFVRKSSWFSLFLFKFAFDKQWIKKLLNYSGMSFISIILAPFSQIYLRNYIINKFGWDAAGWWQAVWRISDVYLMIVTMSLSIYYLPRLSEIKDKLELKKEILNGYKFLLPVTIIMAVGIFISRKFIILLLFSDKFMPMENLFLFQLIGDVLKITSWLLSYLMIAKALTKIFIISEIFFVFTWLLLAIFFMNLYGIIGITIAFASNYLLYTIFCIIYFSKYLNER